MALQAKWPGSQVPLPLTWLTTSGAGIAYARDAANQWSITIPASISAYLEIPIASILPYRVEVGPSTAAVGNLTGFLLRQLLLSYSIAGVNATSNWLTLGAETYADNAARGSVTALGGTLTASSDGGSVTSTTSLPVTQRSALYKSLVTLQTPVQLASLNQRASAEWAIVTPSGSTCKVYGVTLIGDWGLYA